MLFANICKYNINEDVVCKYLQVKYKCRCCLQIFASTILMQMLFANLFKCNINAEVASCIQIFASVLLYHCRCCLQIFANWVSLQRLFANICEYSTISMQMLNANIHVATVYSYSMPGCSLTIERGGRGGRGGLSATWHLQQITEIIHLSFPPPSVLFFGVYKAVTKLLLFESTILRIISCWWLEKNDVIH